MRQLRYYDKTWLEWDHTLPVSLSLPLREDALRGDNVTASLTTCCPTQMKYVAEWRKRSVLSVPMPTVC